MRIFKLLLIVILATTIGTISADDLPSKKVMDYIAVLDLNCGKLFDKEECSILTDTVISELVKERIFKIVDRANRDKILAEIGWQQTGCVEGECTVEMGRQLGVGKIVVGKVSKFGETYIISLQLVNVETALVEYASQEKCRDCKVDNILGAVSIAARNLISDKIKQNTWVGTITSVKGTAILVDGGTNIGLMVGQKLEVFDPRPEGVKGEKGVLAVLEVVEVGQTSSMCKATYIKLRIYKKMKVRTAIYY